MNNETVYKLYNNLHKDNLSFIYQGSFSDEITTRIIDISETNISSQHEQVKISNKVSFLLAECFQNVIRHGEASLRKLAAENTGVFITRNIGKSYYISSANLIENSEVDSLRYKLEQINKLTQEELKQLYINILANNEMSSKGGAGLGLIEMARKSGQKLDFDFEYVNELFSYFYLQIKLQGPDTNEVSEKIDVKIAKEFHHIMTEDNIFIIHKGDFSQHTLVPVLRMIEENVNNTSERSPVRKKIVHVLVEILQNISKHGLEFDNKREGILMMGKKDSRYIIYTGNYIDDKSAEILSEHLGNLTSLSKEELFELYKLTLHLGPTTEKGGAGLGLIDVVRDSNEKVEYSFTRIKENVQFYVLGVRI